MENKINSKVDEIRSFLKKVQPNVTPIKNHPVSMCDEYVMDLYFDMLCVMAQYENEDIANQKRFIQHIMAGCNETMPIDEHIKRSMTITTDKIAEFIIQCRNNNLNEIFFIDSLMITCANGSPNKNQIGFLAELGDTFEFEKNDIKLMSDLSSILLKRDFEALKSFVDKNDNIDNLLDAVTCYITPIIDENIHSDDSDTYYYSLKITNEPLFDKDIDINKRNSVIIENQLICHRICFNSVKNVVIKNCIMRDYDNSGILTFNSVESIEIENCTFSDCGTRNNYQGGALNLTQVESIKIYSSDFKNCGHKNCGGGAMMLSSSPDTNVEIFDCRFINLIGSIGGVFCSNNRSNFYIENSEFQNCNANLCGSIGYGGGEIETYECVCSNCRKGDALFFGCEDYYDTYSSFNSCTKVVECCH